MTKSKILPFDRLTSYRKHSVRGRVVTLRLHSLSLSKIEERKVENIRTVPRMFQFDFLCPKRMLTFSMPMSEFSNMVDNMQ